MSNRIAALRKRSGLTQEQLAEKLGCHWITVSKLERGKIQLTTSWIDKISSLLVCSASDIWDSEITRKTETLTVRLNATLRDRLESILDKMPYRPTVTSVVERGLSLACDELERMITASEVSQ
jgi:DNA-binding XRE family transcriptional regulator